MALSLVVSHVLKVISAPSASELPVLHLGLEAFRILQHHFALHTLRLTTEKTAIALHLSRVRASNLVLAL